MHKDLNVATPSVASSSELLVLAPICPGFVPGLDAVTYRTRAKTLLKTLHGGRKTAHEYNLFRALSDAVERVGVIHSVRVAVLEPEDKILLSVNFDGAYEAYVRVIWQKAARLLDLIFCNTQGYETGWDHSYAAWSDWLQERRVETPFYYGAPGLTRADVNYLRMEESFARRDGDADLNVTRIVIPDAEQAAWNLADKSVLLQAGPYAEPGSPGVQPGPREAIRQGLQGLAGIYRLADLYPPGTPDGLVLHRAARELLPEFERMLKLPLNYGAAIERAGAKRFREALDWFARDEDVPDVRTKPELTDEPHPELPPNVQSGILRPYQGLITHGCICLVAFDRPTAFAALRNVIRVTGEGREPPAGEPRWNLALTFEGLRACGLDEALLAQLPLEFRQGMAQRAGLLGDVHGNHPRRWQLPRLNWPQAVDHPDDLDNAAPVVPLEAVHAMVQVRLGPADGDRDADLRPAIGALLKEVMQDAPGVRPLSVQWVKRLFNDQGDVVEHFGYVDVESSPEFGRTEAWFFPNQVHLGEALLGHPNAADAAPVLPSALQPLLQDGSFLVVRKLRQDTVAFDDAVNNASRESGIAADEIRGKLMGRRPDGRPLSDAASNLPNDFSFKLDPDGRRCPLAAHIRKANPREVEEPDAQVRALPGGRPPRLFRRSLSYVPPARGNDPGDKGLMFMAYNASIGEQFEVVQRWLAGGNSTGGYSGVSDPLLGVPETGRSRWFRFEHDERTVRVRLDGSDDLGGDPRPLVRLEWGAYLFAPSLQGLDALAGMATDREGMPWDPADGLVRIKALRKIELEANPEAAKDAWKAALEDPDGRAEFTSAAIWSAVREHWGGLLRIPYGVLVADARLADEVLSQDDRFTVGEYQKRLDSSIGPIFLGLDEGPDYQRESKAWNDEIMKLGFEDGFKLARDETRGVLDTFIRDAVSLARDNREARWELNLDIREIVEKVLAHLVEEWFGLSEEGGFFKRGGFSWGWREAGPALYPGEFHAPSRHTFQPLPGPVVKALGERHGRHLRLRMNEFLDVHHQAMGGRVSRTVLDALGPKPDLDLAARSIVGVIMGFVPTTEGGLRRIMAEWLRDGTLWSLRARIPANNLANADDAKEVLSGPIRRAMQLRPVPELIWRTATRDDELVRSERVTVEGATPTERLQRGDTVIVSLVSLTQQGLEEGRADVMPVFGGDRREHAHPTHACPGYLPAMGIITGVLSAIVDAPERLRPAASPGILSFEGEVPDVRPVLLRAHEGWRKGTFHKIFRSSALLDSGAPVRKLLAWGDSWFTLSHPFETEEWDLRWALAELGYDTSGFAIHSRSGLTLAEMAAVPRRTGFYSLVKAQPPDAVLLDGGGNDVHATDPDGTQPLAELLREGDPDKPFKPGAVARFVHERLAGQLETVLAKLIEATEGKTPIFVHGYDHPLPDGRGFFPVPGPWLHPVITQGYGYGFGVGCEVMKTLIDELNAMIEGRATAHAADNVHHLKLTGTLAAQEGYDLDGGYKEFWLNELHPSIKGYRALAHAAKTGIEAVLAPVN